MYKRLSIASVAAVLTAAGLWGQAPLVPGVQNQAQQPAGTSSVAGQVVAAGTDQPIAGASVELRRMDCNNFSQPPEARSVITGADGKFLVENLRAGGWCIVATAPGGRYTPAEYLQRGILGRGATLALVDGQTVTGVRLAMSPTGAIGGRVLDEDNDPVAYARVQAMELFHQDGQRRLYILQVAQTNDKGEYRFYWLPAGRYYIAVAPEDTRRRQVVSVQPLPGTGGRREDVMPPVTTTRISPRGEIIEETYVTIYYPGETDPLRAMPVEVTPGSNIGGMDVSLGSAKRRSFHVRGVVANGITGQAAEGAQMRVVPQQWTANVIMPTVSVDAQGAFDIAGVVPGSYILYANQSIPNPVEAAATADGAAAAPLPPIPIGARLTLNVGAGDVDNIRMVLLPGVQIAGRVLIEGAFAEIPRGINVALARLPDLAGVPSPQGRGAVQPNGAFTLPNVGPGEYRVYVTPFLMPFQWGIPSVPQQLQNGYVKTIRSGVRDALVDGLLVADGASPPELEIVLATGGRISGNATSARGEPLSNVTVALVPDLALRRRTDLYRFAVTDISGRFSMTGVAPGNYKAFAWEEVERDAWQDSEFLRPLEARGVAAEVRAGADITLDVIAIPASRP